MGMPASERRLLNVIENGLREDSNLVRMFATFASVTRKLEKPAAAEKLSRRFITVGRGRWRAAGISITPALCLIGITAIGLLLVLGIITGASRLSNSRCATLVASRTGAAFLGGPGMLCRGCPEAGRVMARPPRRAILPAQGPPPCLRQP